MLQFIRFALFRKSLRAFLAQSRRQRRTHTLDSARTVGILYAADSEKNRKEVADFAQKLEKNGKKVTILGFLPLKQAPADLSGNFLTNKDFSWAYEAKGEKATTFAAEKFDLLLCLNEPSAPPVAWVAAHSAATMKIGTATELPHDLDLQLEIPDGSGPRFFFEQLNIYLDKIILTKHEQSAKSS